MAAASVSFRDEVNYTEMKDKYMRHIEMYYATRKSNVSTPWTRRVVDKIKSLIKDGMSLKLSGHPSEHAKYRIMNKYELVGIDDGREILICKRKSAGDPIVQVVPAEECFDIILEAHLKTAHGGRDKISRVIESKYSVPKTSIEFILALCDWCQECNTSELKRKARNRIPQVFHSRAQVSIVDMSDQPDHDFKYILFYLDRFTKFMVLRPLMTKSDDEVAMELLKIFLDFGPPEKIEAYNRSYFMNVLGLIKTVCEDFKSIYSMLPITVPEISPHDVKSMLYRWQSETGTKNWTVGCYMIQWRNNCRLSLDGVSPYSCVFHMKPWFANSNKFIDEKADDKVSEEGTSLIEAFEDACDNESQTVFDSVGEKDDIDNNKIADIMDEDDDIIIITEPPNMYLPPTTLTPTYREQSVKTVNRPQKPIILQKRTVPLTASIGTTTSKGNIETKKKQTKDVDVNKPKSSQTVTNTHRKAVTAQQQPKATASKSNVDTATASTNYDSKTDQSDTGVSKSIETKPKLGNVTMKKECHICRTAIVKPYKCMKCKKSVHMFCSDRLLQQGISQNVLDVICTSCKLVTSRFENLKRKFIEMD